MRSRNKKNPHISLVGRALFSMQETARASAKVEKNILNTKKIMNFLLSEKRPSPKKIRLIFSLLRFGYAN